MIRFPIITLAALTAAPVLFAVNTDMNVAEAGPTLGYLNTGSGGTRTAGFHAAGQAHVFGFTAVDLAARASYDYSDSTEYSVGTRHHVNVEALASVSALGILTPYATVGVGADKNDIVTYSGDDAWQYGPTASAGVEIVTIPKLLHITPSVRYFHADKLETLTYALDFQFHLSAFAVGIRGEYEDNRSRDGYQATALAYAALRF